MEQRVRVFVLAVLTALLLPLTATAASFSGSYEAIYEQTADKAGDFSRLDNYLALSGADVAVSGLSVELYGKYGDYLSEPDGAEVDSDTDLYLGYLRYRTHEGGLDIRAGRFDLVAHGFLTLDGAEVTVRTNAKLGLTVFGGTPRYLETYAAELDDEFRDYGDSLVGGKVFLSGVKDVTAFLSYWKEDAQADDGETVTILDLVGAGFGLRGGSADSAKWYVNVMGEYDQEYEVMYRKSGQFGMTWKDLSLTVRADMYEVDDTEKERELIITMMSNGTEDRYEYALSYAFFPALVVYHSYVTTEIERDNGDVEDGAIIKGGIQGEITSLEYNVGAYRTESWLANATGIYASVGYTSGIITVTADAESVSLDTATEDETFSSYEVEVEAKLGKSFTLAAYYEALDSDDYSLESRTGVRARLDF